MCGFERSPSSPTVIGQLPWERFDLDEKNIKIEMHLISWLNHSAVNSTFAKSGQSLVHPAIMGEGGVRYLKGVVGLVRGGVNT